MVILKNINKLVRNNIPDIIKNSNGSPIFRILSEDEFVIAIFDKFYEEIEEVKSSRGASRCEELADMIELINTLAILEGKNLDHIIELSKLKTQTNGSFDNRIFLKKINY